MRTKTFLTEMRPTHRSRRQSVSTRQRMLLGAAGVLVVTILVIIQTLLGGRTSRTSSPLESYGATAGVNVGAPSGPTSTSGAEIVGREPSLRSGARSAFAKLAREFSGDGGIAISHLNGDRIESMGTLRSGHAWSTMKVPVVVTLIRDMRATGRELSAEQKVNTAAALTRSDNDAAKALFEDLVARHGGIRQASGMVDRTLREAGDFRTHVNTTIPGNGFTTFGQTIWPLGASVKFFRALARGCLLEGPDTRFVLGLMRNVVSDQRWGAGSADLAGRRVALKGGWGPESDSRYLVRQSAIIGSGRSGVVVSMLVKPNGGDTFAAGRSEMTKLARWARRYVNDNGPASAECQR